jgi:hypothetical protein
VVLLLALLACSAAAVKAAEAPAATGSDSTLPQFVKVQLSFDGKHVSVTPLEVEVKVQGYDSGACDAQVTGLQQLWPIKCAHMQAYNVLRVHSPANLPVRNALSSKPSSLFAYCTTPPTPLSCLWFCRLACLSTGLDQETFQTAIQAVGKLDDNSLRPHEPYLLTQPTNHTLPLLLACRSTGLDQETYNQQYRLGAKMAVVFASGMEANRRNVITVTNGDYEAAVATALGLNLTAKKPAAAAAAPPAAPPAAAAANATKQTPVAVPDNSKATQEQPAVANGNSTAQQQTAKAPEPVTAAPAAADHPESARGGYHTV